MTVYLRLEAPFQWVRTEGTDVQGFGEVPDLGSYPISDEESVVGIVPGEYITTHRIKLPAKSRKQFNTALPFALEDSFTEDVEHLHFVCPKWRPGEECIVYAVSKAKLDEWHQLCVEHGVPATRLLPEYALLPDHDVAQCSMALVGTKVLAKRNDGRGITIDADYIDLWLKELPVDAVIAANSEEWTKSLLADFSNRDIRHWPFGDKMASWVEYGNLPEFDVWSDQYRPSSRKSLLVQYRWPVAFTAAAAAILIGAQLFFYFSLHQEIKLITEESQVLAKRLIPDLDYVEPGQERTFVERYLVEQAHGGLGFSLPHTLAAVAPILRSERITLSEIRFKQNELIIDCLLYNLAQIDSLARRFDGLDAFTAKLQGSKAQDGAIVATFSIVPKT